MESNLLSQTLPSQLGKLKLMGGCELADLQLTGPIPTELGSLKADGLFLNGNWLAGSIPTELGESFLGFSRQALHYLCSTSRS